MNDKRYEHFYNLKYIESKTKKTKDSKDNRHLSNKYNLGIKIISTYIKSKEAFGLVLVGVKANMKKTKKPEVKMENKEVKRKIKKRKIKLTKLGKEVVGGIITLSLLGGATTVLASSLDKPDTLEPVETTIASEYDDIFETEANLAPIINETTSVTPTPVEETTSSETETLPTENIETIEETTPTENIEAIEETTPTETNETTLETLEQVSPSVSVDIPELDLSSPMTLTIGCSSLRNFNSDLEIYNIVRERYGLLIDKVASETRWDPRLITAMIALENPDKQDQSAYSTYGLTSITSWHHNQTYNYRYFDENGNSEIRNITINVYDLDNNQLYMGGLYGNVTTGDHDAIIAQIAILENYLENIHNNNYDYVSAGILDIGAYNGGPGVVTNGNINASLNSFINEMRVNHNQNYYSDVFGKMFAALGSNINDVYFTSLNTGETYSYNLQESNLTNELNVSNTINNTHTL